MCTAKAGSAYCSQTAVAVTDLCRNGMPFAICTGTQSAGLRKLYALPEKILAGEYRGGGGEAAGSCLRGHVLSPRVCVCGCVGVGVGVCRREDDNDDVCVRACVCVCVCRREDDDDDVCVRMCVCVEQIR